MQLCALFWICAGVHFVAAAKLDIWNSRPCGVEASSDLIHQSPWLVLLEYFQGNQRTLVRCGGTLIGSRHVITAAHCVKKSLFTRLVARLGEYDLRTDPDVVNGVRGNKVVRLDVVSIHVPTTYDGREDDIAILELAEDSPYTDFIRPACLPSGTVSKGDTFTAAGWGEISSLHVYSHVKKIIPLPYWSDKECRKAYRNGKLPQNIICAGGEEGMDTCRGDSGGPLTLHRDRVELWGVTSSGNVQCGAKGYPGIYTSVISHIEWISDVLRTNI